MTTTPLAFIPDHATLAGKTVVVTGASSEIGSSVCYGAARAGAIVLMLDRKQREMTSLYDEICKQGWPEPMMIELDIRKADESAFQQLSVSLESQFPILDGLVHCAMWGAPLTPVVHTSMETWQATLEQHLIKPMAVTRSLIPLLARADSASIIFTSMDTGRVGRAYWGGIGCAFAGIENMSEILSAELESNQVRVNTLDPGKAKTALRKKFYPGETAEYLRDANDPLIVNSYLYLLSDQSLNDSGLRFTVPSLDD